jgi:CRP/FNR family transcriptional regulator, cyclic AMP receptor protein
LSSTAALSDHDPPDEPLAVAGTPERTRPAADHLALLAADPSFAAAIPAADLPLAARVLCLPRLHLPAGAWLPPERGSWPAPTCGLLLLDGVVARHVALGDRVATQLLGPGDVLDPWPRGSELLPYGVHWSIHEPATAAVLDGRFATAARRWPSLSTTVHERLGAIAERLGTHLAICQLPRVEDRVLALLWHLAERFGRVTPGGVVLALRLTHRLVGELAGAQRPTVSLAFAALLEAGRVMRRADGALLLDAASRAGLAPGARTAGARAAEPAVAGASDAAHADPGDRVRLLQADFTVDRERTRAAMTRVTALRRDRAAHASERRPEPGDAVPGQAA